MNLIDIHLHKIEQALSEEERSEWAAIQGATDDELERLLHVYPQCPPLLISLLRRIGGTYHQQYPEGCVLQPILGSDVGEDFGYYLLSCDDMLNERQYDQTIADGYGDALDDPELIDVAAEIDTHTRSSHWLCFAHCINNGGTSRLYIDFTPTEKGSVGQVVRYLHDPDSYHVLAPSFEQYLATLTQQPYDYVSEEDS